MTDLTKDLELALRLADTADAVTMARFGANDLAVETKPDRTPVTEADRAAELAIREQISRERPDDAVLGEEDGLSGSGDRVWVLDPIDGTKQYLRGLPSWGTLIALREADQTLCAVVSAPALGRRWWATLGGGAWSDGERLAVSPISVLEGAVIMHGDISAWDPVGGPEPLINLIRDCWQSRGYGDFWGYCAVAEGKAEICAEPGPTLWDLAAPALIVEEAGGRFSSLEGSKGPGHGSGLATNGHLHDVALAALAPSHGPVA